MLKCEFLEIIVNGDSSGVEFKRDGIRNFHCCLSRARSHLNTNAYRFLLSRFCPNVHIYAALVCH
ncbi:hypothetical protein GC087_03770 [Pantoea sp. JZ2]|nr:hypothetical protein GC087_03770 [Pantoea sp. JZ2]